MARILGILVGYIVRGCSWFWRKYESAIHFILAVTAFVLISPFISKYLAQHGAIPNIPVSAIVGLAVATLFLVVFGSCMYILIGFIQQLTVSQRVAGYTAARGPMNGAAQPQSDGAFIVTSDESLRDAEDLAILKKRGILSETDVAALASEIGHATLLRNRGRTE